MTKSIEEQTPACKQALAFQEGLRPTLGDAVVEATLAALHKQLAELEAQVAPPDRSASKSPSSSPTSPASRHSPKRWTPRT